MAIDSSQNEKLGELTTEEKLLKRLSELESRLKTFEDKKPIKRKEVPEKEFSHTDYVTVMSLCPNILNLSTKPRGQGKLFTFKKFGETKRMFYSDLLDIISTSQSFLEKGYFYILDKRIVELNGLSDIYNTMLTKEQIEEILACTPNSVNLFSMANPNQQKTVVDMFIELIRTDKHVDFNIIELITKISNVNILEKASEAKKDMSLENR